MLNERFKKMLVMRRFLFDEGGVLPEKTEGAYYNAFLLTNFGIVVDKPNLLTKGMILEIQKVYKLDVPNSFYANPQDTRYYTKGELLVEQIVSYFLVESGTGIYERVPLFKKELPEYFVGDEVTVRKFSIVSEDEANGILGEIATSLCSYTRPFSLAEREDFKALFANGYVSDNSYIGCKDNIISLLEEFPKLAKFLDKKDLMKLSILYVGEHKYGIKARLSEIDPSKALAMRNALLSARDCPLTKKQAKYYNKLVKSFGVGQTRRKQTRNAGDQGDR